MPWRHAWRKYMNSCIRQRTAYKHSRTVSYEQFAWNSGTPIHQQLSFHSGPFFLWWMKASCRECTAGDSRISQYSTLFIEYPYGTYRTLGKTLMTYNEKCSHPCVEPERDILGRRRSRKLSSMARKAVWWCVIDDWRGEKKEVPNKVFVR